LYLDRESRRDNGFTSKVLCLVSSRLLSFIPRTLEVLNVLPTSASTPAAAYARRTKRLGDLQHYLALALGGAAGARLAEQLAVPVSVDTL
jgi:hypothetical protein